MKKKMIVLPFFVKLNTKCASHGVKLKSMKYSAMTDDTRNGFKLYGFETALFKRSKKPEDSEWVVLEKQVDDIPDESYIALIDLLTRHWKYALNRTILLKARSLRITFPPLPNYCFNSFLVSPFKMGLKIISTNHKFRIALMRWHNSYTREDPLDTVLDCCSALEAAINASSELRLRISISVYHLLRYNKRKGFTTVYNMYGIRNKLIHGTRLPTITRNEQYQYIDTVSAVLKAIVVL